jgi:F-type H+-transporting ATPase subunit b
MPEIGTAAVPLASNFLVPNGTFFVELIAFGIIVWILAKWVIPPVNRAMTDRQNAIRKQFADLEEAQSDARTAEKEYKEELSKARHEAAKIREEAREQGAAIIADMRKQAQEESERILRHGRAQLEAERSQAVQSLRNEVGTMATELAGRIVGESLEDDERQSRTVERFLAALEDQGRQADRSETAGAS